MSIEKATRIEPPSRAGAVARTRASGVERDHVPPDPRGVALRPVQLLQLNRLVGNGAVAHVVARLAQPRRDPADGRMGTRLSEANRRRFDHSLGWDFSEVRVRTGADVDDATRRAGAKALTADQEIQVASRVGDLQGDDNRHLLAHELAHVVQQNKARRPDLARSAASAALSAAKPGPQAAPVVTAIAAGAEIGAGRTLDVSATAAGKAALTWTLVGAPAGVTVAPRTARSARISAAAPAAGVAPVGAGTVFQVTAALTSTPADSFTSGNITLVGITSIAVTPAPAFAPVATAGGGTQAPPANALDPNRDGLAGNTGVVAAVTAPAGRPVTVSLPSALGSTVSGTTITTGSKTGPLRVRVEDDATRTRAETVAGSAAYPPMTIDAAPTRVSGFGAQVAPPAGVYGIINPIRFASSDPSSTSLTMTRVTGETITAGGSDAFGLMATINLPIGPNPVPLGGLSVPANAWNDQLFTGIANIDVNNFVGPNAPGGKLPAVWTLRQGFHHFGWNGTRAPVEIDHGVHRRSLVQQGAGFAFRTEHEFPGAKAPVATQPYAATNPLITFTGIATAPLVPAATGLAADGAATANVTTVSSVAGRTVGWNVVSGPIAFTTGGAAAPIAVATPAVVQAGHVAGPVKVTVVDTAFPNRIGKGTVTVSPVALTNMTAAPKKVPVGTNVTTVSVNAAPGGRTLVWSVDAAATAAGFAAPAAAAPAPAVATSATVTRPAGFTGRVTVTAADSVLPAKRATVRIQFL